MRVEGSALLRFGVHVPTNPNLVGLDELRELAASLERLGYDSAWVADHAVDTGPPGSPPASGGLYEPLLTLAGLASATSKLKLGTAILLPLRHPILLAKQAATLDRLSGGRLILGLGAGWSQAEFDALGVPFKTRGRFLDELITALKALWGEGTASFAGRFFAFSGVSVSPKPLQKPHPPLWIGGNSPAAIDRAARLGDGWIPADPTVEELRAGVAELKRRCAAAGRRAEDVIVASHIYACIGRTPSEVERLAGFLTGMTGEPLGAVKGWALVGTPGEVRRRLEDYLREGVSYHVFSFPPTGDLPAMCELLMREALSPLLR